MSSVLASSATTEQANSLSDAADSARQLLLCCQDIQENNLRRIASAQLSRFNLWASNIGVFSSHHASLDYRLRTAPAAKIAIQGNLEILCKHLIRALSGRSLITDDVLDAFAETKPRAAFEFGRKLLHRPLPDSQECESAFALAEDTITTLHQLSLAIRKASNRNSLAKVPALFDVDGGYTVVIELGETLDLLPNEIKPLRFEATASFEEFLRRSLKCRWLRKGNDRLLDSDRESYRQFMLLRCITSISVRRRQLAYFQRHQAKLAVQNVTKYEAHTEKASRPQNLMADLFGEAVLQRPSYQELPETLLSETAPSEFQSSSFRPAPSTAAPSSAVSSSDSGGLGTAGPFEVPPAPVLEPVEKEKMCPYCCLVFPRKTFSKGKKSRRWKRHLLDDLQPYICLFKNCEQSGKTYQMFKDWQAHLSEPHVEDWQCPLPHPIKEAPDERIFLFDKASEFQDHLNLYHPDLDPSSNRSVIQAASRPAFLPQWCFVCLAEQTTAITLQKHIAIHLEQAFLLALPGRDDVKDSDAIASGQPSGWSSESGSVNLQEVNLPDIRGLYGDNSTVNTTRNVQGLSKQDFAAGLSAIDTVSSSSQNRNGLLKKWTTEQSAKLYVRRFRAAVWVVIFVIRLQRQTALNETSKSHPLEETARTKMPPLYFFRVDEMRQNAIARPRDIQGIWYPPRVPGWNELVPGDSTGTWFCFDPARDQVGRAYPIAALPQSVVHYKDVSVYYDHDYFWCVPYDTTQFGVGDWKQDLPKPEEEDAPDDQEEERFYQDWHLMRFSYDETNYASSVQIGAEKEQLLTQHPDQTWVHEIFPDLYHATAAYRTPDTRYGALNGDLGLLLALVAFSVRPDHVSRAMERCVRGDGWRAYGNRERRSGWRNRRGVVVRIFIPASTTREDMKHYEDGHFGNIYN